MTSKSGRDDLARSLLSLLEGLNTPRSLTVHLLFKYKEHDQLVALECDPSSYLDDQSFRDDYVATALYRKAEYLSTTTDKRAKALEKAKACETRCRETNQKFRSLATAPNYTGVVASVLHTAARKIAMVLGDFDPEEWFETGRWGPGASVLVRKDTSSEEKFRKASGITPDLHDLIRPLLHVAYPAWDQHLRMLTFVAGNEMTFVPKDARSDRSISIEPDLNVWFQLGLGKMIRRRLRSRAGIDLNTQRNNQSAARVGAITGLLATLDLSSASDTISTSVVRFLVEDDTWFHVLDCARSRYGSLEGTRFRWEKFSSMGNGFTFELESLLFWAIANASCEVYGCDPTVWVFGDDIVLPTEVTAMFTEVMDFCGFTLNKSKSFSTGYFRESCGVHYWETTDCQPFYSKAELETPHHVFKTANAISRLARRFCGGQGRDSRFARSVRCLQRSLPRRFRLGIPEGIGDVGFVIEPGETDLVTEVTRLPLHPGHAGHDVKVLGLRAVKRQADHAGVLLARLHEMGVDRDPDLRDEIHVDDAVSKGNEYPLRGRTVPRFSWVRVLSWGRLGPWV